MVHQPPTHFDDLYESPLLNAVRAEDQNNPDRICAWCFHPRNSDECQFAAKHAPYLEHFSAFE